MCKFDSQATVTIYCRQTSVDAVDMGSGFKVECSAADFSDVASRCKNVDGLCVSFNGTYEDVTALSKFFRLQVSSEFEQNGLYVVCGKSPKICSGVTVAGETVNLQIAYKDGVVHIGSPLILGDY